nr:hypothetical protein [Tanacetum cinerariifolium]
FWASVSIKKTNDAVKLQALIDRKKVIITEDTIRQALRLNNTDDYLASHNIKYTSPALTQKVFASIRRIGNGFSGVEIPLFDAMLVPQQVQADDAEVEEAEDEDNELMKTCATLTKKVANLEQDKISQALKIVKLKQRFRRMEKKRRNMHSGLKRLKKAKAYHLDLQHAEKVLIMHDTGEAEPNEVEQVLEVVTTAKLMTEVVTTAAPITIAAQVPKPSAPRKRRGVVIQDLEETVVASVIVHSEVKSKDKGKGILIQEPKPLKRKAQKQVKRKEKQDNTVMGYQALKRKPLTKAQARKNMMIYLKNMVGFNMDFFKATPLESKVLVIDYQIHHENNKPYYKIIISDGTHKLFLSFITLLKNFNIEDLEALWKLVKERYAPLHPHHQDPSAKASLLCTNIFFVIRIALELILLKTLRKYVKRLLLLVEELVLLVHIDAMILLVEKKCPLTHFTLEQMLNNVRLEVEEESEMSLELLRKYVKRLLLLVEELVLLVHIDAVRENDDAAEEIKKLL